MDWEKESEAFGITLACAENYKTEDLRNYKWMELEFLRKKTIPKNLIAIKF